MSRRIAMFAFSLAVVVTAAAARADSGPVFVVPSRPGVPIVINGVDASYAVVEGDWGLARPGHGTVTVIGGRAVLSNPVYSQRNFYHPRYGYPPPRGRLEIEPPANRALPEPAETFSRSWSTQSQPAPIALPQPRVGEVSPTLIDPYTFQQPMVVAPPGRRR
jgi:hypothetical protein